MNYQALIVVSGQSPSTVAVDAIYPGEAAFRAWIACGYPNNPMRCIDGDGMFRVLIDARYALIRVQQTGTAIPAT